MAQRVGVGRGLVGYPNAKKNRLGYRMCAPSLLKSLMVLNLLRSLKILCLPMLLPLLMSLEDALAS